MTGWIEGDVTANGIRLHYYRTGGDKPSVVLSHGYSDSGLCWLRLARDLEADYDVVMYDARGHGLSEAPDEGYTSMERADDLAGLIRALGLEKPAIMGHSMGASTTLYCAARYPGLMRAVVLEDGGIRSSEPGRGFDPASLAQSPGYGLLTIRERVQLLGGWMRIKSAPGQGSIFFIAVPDPLAPSDGSP